MAWIVLALSTQAPEGVAGRRVADEPADLLKDPERLLIEPLEMENVQVFQAEPGGKSLAHGCMIEPRMAASKFATAGDRLQPRVEISLLNRGLSLPDSA